MRVFEFIVAFAFLVASFWVMGAAFTAEFAGYELLTFLAGILLFTIAFAIPGRRFLKA
jgi:hypothetical protein